jgi:NAD+ kinase
VLKSAVVLHAPKNEGAAAFATQLGRELERAGVKATVADAWAEPPLAALDEAELVACIGGDGTVLRAARIIVPRNIPLLGINMGRLGFLTDMSPRDCFQQVEKIIGKQNWRVEERVMVRCDITDSDGRDTRAHGLNDIVVSRSSPGRPIYVDVRIDGARLANYRCDGIIVATPTGSTGYSLSAGGPILAPSEHHLVMTPVAAHLALARSLVLQPESIVELQVTSDSGAIVSIDGQEEVPVSSAVRVQVRQSEYVTRFVRFREPQTFYSDLAERLETQLSSAMSPGA